MKKNGFTLVELMIAVAIVAILAVIAVPAYNQYVRRANRTDATNTLMQDAQALERCYSQSFAYAGCAGAAVGAASSIGGKYTVTIAVPDPAAPAGTASYIITAVPLAAVQVADTACQTFSLNTQGTQVALDGSNNPNTATCWGGT